MIYLWHARANVIGWRVLKSDLPVGERASLDRESAVSDEVGERERLREIGDVKPDYDVVAPRPRLVDGHWYRAS